MIQNLWYGIMDAREIKGDKPVGVTRLGEKLVLWRNKEGGISCIYDQCCHRGASLCAGKIVHDTVRCPFHGFAYDASGKVVLIPANGSSMPVPDRSIIQGPLKINWMLSTFRLFISIRSAAGTKPWSTDRLSLGKTIV